MSKESKKQVVVLEARGNEYIVPETLVGADDFADEECAPTGAQATCTGDGVATELQSTVYASDMPEVAREMLGSHTSCQDATATDSLEALLEVQERARTLAVDATARLEGTISDVLASVEELRRFRNDLFRWESDFVRCEFRDLALFVRQYWFLTRHLQEITSIVASAPDSAETLEKMRALDRLAMNNRTLLERACAGLGLKVVHVNPGDRFDEALCVPFNDKGCILTFA